MGPADSGMHLFSSDASIEETIITGFGLEMGLRDFYLTMTSKVQSAEAAELFKTLAEIEILHEKQLLDLYNELVGKTITLEEFQEKIVEPSMEGGLTTEEYMQRYDFDMENELDILSLAMSIEVQALDLYLRAAEGSKVNLVSKTLHTIADEERSHITMLGQRIEQLKDIV